jgi:hypothetical protein
MDLTNSTTILLALRMVTDLTAIFLQAYSQLSVSKSESTILNRRANIKIRIPLVEM